MEREKKPPKRLYKYRDLSARTLDMVVGDKVHFADPSTFNDPLDTRPSLENDVDDGELGSILRILIEQRTGAEMHAGAKAMKLDDAETKEWIEEHSRGQAAERMAEIEYGAMDPDYDFEAALRSQLRYLIEMEFLRGYEKGIVSLAERDNCPLMWSHYQRGAFLSAPCILPKVLSSRRSQSWLVTMSCCPYRRVSRALQMKRSWMKCTRRSATCSMWPAHGQEIGFWFLE